MGRALKNQVKAFVITSVCLVASMLPSVRISMIGGGRYLCG